MYSSSWAVRYPSHRTSLSKDPASVKEVAVVVRSIRGVVANGVIKPLEMLPYPEGTEVTVTLPTKAKRVWERIRESIAEEYPDLREMTVSEAIEEFERLSDKIAEHHSFKDWREMDRWMKGDEYDLTRH